MKYDIKQVAPVAYHGKMMQPGVILQVSGPKSPRVPVEAIDDWLLRGCLIAVPPLRSVAESDASLLLWRSMQWACSLCRWVRLPSVDPGDILSLTEDSVSGDFVARVALPSPEGVSVQVSGLALALAGRMLADFPDSVPAAHEIERISDEIDRVFLEPMGKKLGGGRSTVPMLRAAYHLGIPFSHLSEGIFQVGEGSAGLLVDRSSVSDDSGIGSRVSHDKFRTASLLRRAGLPAPVHALVTHSQRAVDVARRLGYPVVIKPADRDRGEGVTTGVRDGDTARDAFNDAASQSKRVLVEKEVPGICYRILVVRGHIAYCTGRKPKGIVGDGIHSVAQLIAGANAEQTLLLRQLRMKPFPDDALALECIRAAGYTLTSIPAAGVDVPLRPRESIEWGGLTDVATDRLHPANAEVASAAARLLGLEVCGVDMISEDISVPWYENGAVINELNYAPHVADRLTPLAEALKLMLALLVPGGGRIPVHAFVGQGALDAALRWQELCITGGKRCYIASSEAIYGPRGKLNRTVSGFLAASRLLLHDRTVDSLALVIDSDEILDVGLPVQQLRELTVVDKKLRSAASGASADQSRVEDLLALLKGRRRTSDAQTS